jgi:hypothetical protein
LGANVLETAQGNIDMPSLNARLSAWLAPSMQATWRILYAMVLVQIPGAAIGWCLQPIGDAFTDCWYGGALSMPIGFAFGLLWHSHAVPGTINRNRRAVLVYGGFSIVLAIVAVLTRDMWIRAFAAP